MRSKHIVTGEKEVVRLRILDGEPTLELTQISLRGDRLEAAQARVLIPLTLIEPFVLALFAANAEAHADKARADKRPRLSPAAKPLPKQQDPRPHWAKGGDF